MYLDRQGKVISGLSTKGYLAVAVPGTVMGLERASQYGTMTRKQVMAPAIELASKGFVLQQGDVNILNWGKEKFKQPNVAAIFLKNGKNSYRVGDRLVQLDLAQSLRTIADKGANAFYLGAIATELVS